MAIDTQYARFLLFCRRDGVSFRHTLTLGRLNYYLSVKETTRAFREASFEIARYPQLRDYSASRYAEPFFEALGAERVESLDASPYENATIVHDLNFPVPDTLKGGFDVVCDSGTIEHAMNFPMVVRNAMKMVKIGGHFIVKSPANNCFGHGFFQFSPELWFRVLSPVQGFEIVRMVAAEYGPRSRWFEVADPAVVKERVALINRYPVILFVVARKTAAVPVLQTFPQQSDYVQIWEKTPAEAAAKPAVNWRHRLLDAAPALVRFMENYHSSSWLNPKLSFRNRRFFKPVKR